MQKTAELQAPSGITVATDHSGLRWFYWAILAVFVFALALRMAYLAEIRDIGFFHVPLSDALVYDERAQGIASGDWLGPDDFIHAPLYAYMLAGLRALGFESLLAPRLMQAVFGAFTCVLVMSLVRRVLKDQPRRDSIALCAGVIFAIYPPAIFFDGLIQKSSTVMLLSTLLLWLLYVARDAFTMRWWFACGIVFGLLILVRQNALALVPLLVIFVWTCSDQLRSRRALGIAVACLGFALAVAPWVVRHKIVLGEFFISTPNMGQNFAMGNHPNATGTYLPAQRGKAAGEAEHAVWKRAAEADVGREMTAAEISDYYMDASIAYIKDNPWPWLVLTGKKLVMVFGAYEAPDTEDYYQYFEHSKILWYGDTFLHFGVLGPLAVAGVILTLPHWRRLWMLHGWIVINTIAIAAFVVFARYRLPILPVVILFASAGIIQGFTVLSARQWRRAVASVIGLLAAAVVMNWPIHSPRQPHAFSYVNHAVALAEAGRYSEALLELDKAHAIEPGDVDAHWIRASVLFDMQRFDESLAHYRAALAGDSAFGGAHRGIGTVMLAAGRYDDAAASFRMALELDDHDHVAMNKLAVVHASRGESLQAMALLERAAAIDPKDAEVQLNLGNVHLALGRLDDARLAYERAIGLQRNYFEAHLNLANLHAAMGELDAAITHMRIALEIQPRDRQLLMMLINRYVQAGRQAEAIELLRRRIAAGEADLAPLLEALQTRQP